MSTIRVALVEDHPEYRDTVTCLLDLEEGISPLWKFGSAERALRTFSVQKPMVRPDVLLLDLNLPGQDGLEAMAELMGYLPNCRIVVLTQSDREADVLRALSLGAAGYLLKSARGQEIVEAIRTVEDGGSWLDSRIAKYIVSVLRDKLPRDEVDDLLTPREMEVISLIAEGLAKKEIAAELGIGTTTIVSHVSHIYEKLSVKNAPEAVAKAFGLGILPVKEKE